MEFYHISYNNTFVGKACIKKQGLYAMISANCVLSSSGFPRLAVKSASGCIDLGVMIRAGEQFTLCTRVSAKKIDWNTITFSIIDKCDTCEKTLIPIKPTEPFMQLEIINNLQIVVDEGDHSIWLQEIS